MPKSRVLVIGGGPAGSACAYFLAKNKIDVTLIDKDRWPRDKVCGGALTTNCFDVLEKMEVLKDVHERANFIYNGYIIHSPEGEQISSPVRKRTDKGTKNYPYSYVIKRDIFDNLLLNKAKSAQVKVLTQTEAIGVDVDKKITVKTKDGKDFECEILIVADGSGSSITRYFVEDHHKGSAIAVKGIYKNVKGLTKNLEFFLDDDLGFGYGWLFPMANDRANIGIGLDIDFLKKRKRNIRDIYYELLEREAVKPRFAEAELEGDLMSFPIRMGFDTNAFRQGNVLFVGDAAKLVYPLSGEGIAYALQSGELAAKVISEVYDNQEPDYKKLTKYEIMANQVFGDFKTATRLQNFMSKPRVLRFFFRNSVYDYELGQRTMAILEHTADVSSFFNVKDILYSFVVALKRKIKRR